MDGLIDIKNLFRIKKQIVVYTAIFGDYDNLVDPPESSMCDFICFTDNKNLKSNIYKIVLCQPTDLDPRRSAKIYKIKPHIYFPEYKYSVWLDGSVIIKTNKFYIFVKKVLKKHDMAFLKHPDRDCIFKEAEACIELQKDNSEIIIKQVNGYKNEGYPEKNGLIAGGVILRNNRLKKVEKINNDWWKEINQKSIRDQLSFNYVAWKNNFQYFEIEENVWDNIYFKINNHKL